MLFYSNFCQFSKEVLSRIIKLNVKNQVVLICVDVYRSKLPSNLSVVPTLMTHTGDMVIEEAIHERLDSLTSQNTPRDMFTGSATSFSFVDDAQGDGGFGGEDHYGVFGDDQKIYTPEDDMAAEEVTAAANHSSRSQNTSFEQLQSQRDQEMQNFLKNNPRTDRT